MKKFKRVLAFISDTHIGSRFALFPPNFSFPEGNRVKLNAGQKKLYIYWKRFCRTCAQVGVDTVIHCGDAIHGNNPHGLGRSLMLPELETQADACIELLTPLVKGREFHLISGSLYHESREFQIHQYIARQLKGKFHGPIFNARIRGTSRVFNIAHGEGGSWIYRATMLDREGLFQLAAQAVGKIPKIDVCVRGHFHSFMHLHLPNQHLIQLPCWLSYTPDRVYLKSYGKMQPDIGGVIVLIDTEDRISVWHYLYPAPRVIDFIREV